MNRIASRGAIVVILALALALGFGLFVAEFIMKSDGWVVKPGSPHVFKGENLNCGVIVDSEGILLLDMQDSRTYSTSELIRKSTVHWLGDRYGKINAPALAAYADEMVGYDLINGVYTYSDTVGVSKMTINSKTAYVNPRLSSSDLSVKPSEGTFSTRSRGSCKYLPMAFTSCTVSFPSGEKSPAASP